MRKYLYLIAAFGFSAIFFQCKLNTGDDGIVARVNKAVLTTEDLNQAIERQNIKPEHVSQFIEGWINREILFQEAKQLNIDKDRYIKIEIEKIKKEYMINKLLETQFAEKIRISEEEIATYYENNHEQFTAARDEIHMLHLLINTRTEADMARTSIVAGKSFQEVAREQSVCMFRDKGGDMGFITEQDVIPAIWNRAARVDEGQISPVFQSDFGFHILKVKRKYNAGDVRALDSVRNEIAERLRVSKERSVYYDLLFKLQNRANVYISIPKLDAEEPGN